MYCVAFRGKCWLTLGPLHDSAGFDSWAFLDSADLAAQACPSVQDSAGLVGQTQLFSRLRRVYSCNSHAWSCNVLFQKNQALFASTICPDPLTFFGKFVFLLGDPAFLAIMSPLWLAGYNLTVYFLSSHASKEIKAFHREPFVK